MVGGYDDGRLREECVERRGICTIQVVSSIRGRRARGEADVQYLVMSLACS